jgi:hypothetical protein
MLEYVIPMKVIEDKIREERDFSLNEVNREIIARGGVLGVSSGFKIRDYMETLEKMGVVKYNPFNNNYTLFNGELDKKLEEKLSIINEINKGYILRDIRE